jgi:hypothetical protein
MTYDLFHTTSHRGTSLNTWGQVLNEITQGLQMVFKGALCVVGYICLLLLFHEPSARFGSNSKRQKSIFPDGK